MTGRPSPKLKRINGSAIPAFEETLVHPIQHGGQRLFSAGGEGREKGNAHRAEFQSERRVKISYPHLNTARPIDSRLFVPMRVEKSRNKSRSEVFVTF